MARGGVVGDSSTEFVVTPGQLRFVFRPQGLEQTVDCLRRGLRTRPAGAESDAERSNGGRIGCVEVVEHDGELAAVAGGIGAMLIAGPKEVAVVGENEIPVVREQSVVRERLVEWNAIENGPVREAITLSQEPAHSSPKLLKLWGQSCGDPAMLGEQALRRVVARRAVSGVERHNDLEAFERDDCGTAIVTLHRTQRYDDGSGGLCHVSWHFDAHPSAARRHGIVGRLVVQKQRASSVEHAGRRIRRHRTVKVDGRPASVEPVASERAADS